MAFIVRRAFSTTVRRWRYHSAIPSLTTPALVGRGAALETSELQQLAQKARGHWKELSKEEVAQCKRPTYVAL